MLIMKKKTNHDKAQKIADKILKNNDGKRNKNSIQDPAMRFEAGDGFDSFDFSPETWKKN